MHARTSRLAALPADRNLEVVSRRAPLSRTPSGTARSEPFPGRRDDVWLGSIRGTRRFIWTGILASAGIFLTVWIGLLWLMTWLMPAVF